MHCMSQTSKRPTDRLRKGERATVTLTKVCVRHLNESMAVAVIRNPHANEHRNSQSSEIELSEKVNKPRNQEQKKWISSARMSEAPERSSVRQRVSECGKMGDLLALSLAWEARNVFS